MAATSTSRASVLASLIALLRRGLALALERGLQRVPGQRGALHAYGELAHAGEGGELAELGTRVLAGAGRVARKEAVEALEEPLHLLAALALERLRHHRGRGGRDRATRALEAHVLDDPVLEPHVDRGLVAAEGVEALGAPRGLGHLPEVPRLLGVVEDRLLVELAEVGLHRNITWTLRIPAVRASSS